MFITAMALFEYIEHERARFLSQPSNISSKKTKKIGLVINKIVILPAATPATEGAKGIVITNGQKVIRR